MPRAQRETGLLKIGKRQTLPENFLIRLVTLARDQHHVIGGRFSDGDTDGLGAIDDAFGNRPRSCCNLVQDFHRVFSARVITGNDDTIGLLACQLTHDRALAGVAIAATAEHAYQPPLARTHRRAQGLQHLCQGIRGVGVVDDDQRLTHPPHQLHAPCGRRQARQAWLQLIERQAARQQRTRDCQQI